MKLLIDAQSLQTDSRFRGIGRYSAALIRAILRHGHNHEIHFLFNSQCDGLYFENIPELKTKQYRNKIHLFDAVPNNANETTKNINYMVRDALIASIAPDVILITSLFEGGWSNSAVNITNNTYAKRTATILYDLIPWLHPEQYLNSETTREYYNEKISHLKNSALLLAISESSRHEAIQHLSFSDEKVVNISSAVDATFSPQRLSESRRNHLNEKYQLNDKFVMYAPGGFDPRKNFDRLIEAYSKIPQNLIDSHKLVIVSKLTDAQRHDLNQMIVKHGLTNQQITFTGFVSDEDLIDLYRYCSLFVFPSIHEGFGLPVLEAINCGAVVIGANTTSVPEVLGHSDALFNPYSVIDMSNAICRALSDKQFRKNLQQHFSEYKHRFSWDISAKIALRELESLYHKTNNINRPAAINQEGLIEKISALNLAILDDLSLRQTARAIEYIYQPESQRILLDISTLVHSDARTGIQRVTRSLCAHFLGRRDDNISFVPVYFDQSIYRYAHNFMYQSGFNTEKKEDSPVDFYQGDICIALDLNMHLATAMRPLHDYYVRRGVRFMFIVYDLLPVLHPEWNTPNNVQYCTEWLNHISAYAEKLICISESVATDLRKWLAASPPKRFDASPEIHYFHMGADIHNSVPSRGLPTNTSKVIKAISVRPTFLMVSTIEPRKGYAQALTAFELLWQNNVDVNLVIVGKLGWMVDAVQHRLLNHPEKKKRLFWLEGVSDEYLELLYTRSTCLISASEGEGFGLPLIEAAQHKLPIIARDLDVFREVAGEHAFFFSGLEAENLAQSIQQWLVLYQKTLHPRSDQMPWLTWNESSAQLLGKILH